MSEAKEPCAWVCLLRFAQDDSWLRMTPDAPVAGSAGASEAGTRTAAGRAIGRRARGGPATDVRALARGAAPTRGRSAPSALQARAGSSPQVREAGFRTAKSCAGYRQGPRGTAPRDVATAPMPAEEPSQMDA